MSPVMRHVLASYAEKVVVVLAAVGCFTGISFLGHLTDQRKIHVNPEMVSAIGAAAGIGIKDEKNEDMTTQELTAFVEHLTDAVIWNEHALTVQDLQKNYRAQLAQDAKLAAKSGEAGRTPDTNAVFANSLAAADAQTRSRIAAVHARVEAKVIHLKEGDTSFLSQMADEKSSLHVLFEIMWYALMIVGVLACSFLLMVAFTALPFTSIDGEWTKRIEEILKTAAPGAARAVAIAPLAAAAIIGGTVLTGASYATVPGGISREVMRREQTIENHPVTNEGSPYYDERKYTQSGIDEAVLIRQLDFATGRINSTTQNHAAAVSACVRDVSAGVIEQVHGSAGAVLDKAEGIELVASAATGHASAARTAAETTADQTGRIDRRIANDGESIDEEQQRQDGLQSHSIAATTAVDDRGFWGRNFGRTQYKIGAAAIDAMNARMSAEKISESDQLAVHSALRAMTTVPPLNSSRFREALARHGMPEPMITCYFRTLLHVSALPRN